MRCSTTRDQRFHVLGSLQEYTPLHEGGEVVSLVEHFVGPAFHRASALLGERFISQAVRCRCMVWGIGRARRRRRQWPMAILMGMSTGQLAVGGKSQQGAQLGEGDDRTHQDSGSHRKRSSGGKPLPEQASRNLITFDVRNTPSSRGSIRAIDLGRILFISLSRTKKEIGRLRVQGRSLAKDIVISQRFCEQHPLPLFPRTTITGISRSLQCTVLGRASQAWASE